MTLKELSEIDHERAYSGWMTVKEAKLIGDIPEKYAPYFEDYCTCGSENIIKHGLTMMTCADPKCPIKQGYAISEMLARFGVKGLKEATCSKIYSAFMEKNKQKPFLKFNSFVELLAVPWEEYPISIRTTAKGAEFYQACQRIKTKTLTFGQLVSTLAIPSLGNDAEKLMEGISNVEEMLLKMKEEGSVQAFCYRRGFKAPMVAFNLRNSVYDILAANLIFNGAIRQEGCLKINVCMTGAMSFRGSRTTKERFLNDCNELCIDKDGVPLIELKMTSAIESNPFILYSRESGDRKFVAGTRRGIITDEFGTHSVLMKTDDFYAYLERVMIRWNQEKTTDQTKNLNLLMTILMESMNSVEKSEQQLAQSEAQGVQEMGSF